MQKFFIHPTSIVDTQHIGQSTSIWAFAHVMKNARIGSNCNIGDHCFIESGAIIGHDVTIKNGSMIWEGVTLEDGVFVGPDVLFTNDRHPRSPRLAQARKRYSTRAWLSPTFVRRGASIGAGAIIIAGIAIGEFAMVGAGAVVAQDIPPYALVTGSPARVRGWVCQCGQPLKFQEGLATCNDCGLSYVKDADSVSLATRNL
ncbi:MAG: N-acetyltransferase [Anaerolineales bacterium]|nr:MAG: N-acetyltransferase [Anaerolineales bacterium]